MTHEARKYFHQGCRYQELGQIQAATDSFKVACKYDKHLAEAWHLSGANLIHLGRNAEAGMYLYKALDLIEERLEAGNHRDRNFYRQACVYALLMQKKEALEALAQALEINPQLVESAEQEGHLGFLHGEDEFQQILSSPKKQLAQIRYRGRSLRFEDLDIGQLNHRHTFLDLLDKHAWQTESHEPLLSSKEGASPQASAVYQENPHLLLSVDYYLDEKLIYLMLQNRGEHEDNQAYRLYHEGSPENVLEILIDHQNKLDEGNWTEFIGEAVDVCHSLLFEMPDGRKVRVA